jgi:YggT family protein
VSDLRIRSETIPLTPRSLLTLAANVYTWLIILRALASWVQPAPNNPVLRVLHVLTEPVLFPLRRLVPPRVLGGLDVSPVLAILLLQWVLWVLLD